MQTVHCTRAVFQALAGVGGVTRAGVTLGQAEIDHDGRVSDESLAAAVELVGYRLIARRELPRSLSVIPLVPEE